MHITNDFHNFLYDSTNLISLYTKTSCSSASHRNPLPNTIHNNTGICLPFRMFKTVFTKLHEHSHTGIEITYNTCSQYYFIPYLEKWFSISIIPCPECQRNKRLNMKIQTAPTQSFSEHVLLLITEALRIQKDLLSFLDNTNPIFT